MPWSRRLQRNDRLTHTLSSVSPEHTHTCGEEEWQITAAARVHTWTCDSMWSQRLLLIHASVFFPSLSQSLLSCSEMIFPTSLSFSSLFYFLAPNSTVSFSIYLLFSSLSLLWFLRWLLPQSSPVFPLSLSLSLSLSPPSVSHSLLDNRLLWVETGQR